MGKIRFTIRTSYGEISVEGDSLLDFQNILGDLGVSRQDIGALVDTVRDVTRQKLQEQVRKFPISVTPSKPELTGVIEYTTDGKPRITIQPSLLTSKDVIGLILYAKSPNSVSMKEITDLVAENWRSVEMPYISATLTKMRGFVIKEGSRGSYMYKLSGSGRNWIENELLPKLKLGRALE